MSRIPRQPETLNVVPVALKSREPDEEEALALASDRDPATERATAWGGVVAMLLLIAFLAACLLR